MRTKCLSLPVYGILLQQPEVTSTHGVFLPLDEVKPGGPVNCICMVALCLLYNEFHDVSVILLFVCYLIDGNKKGKEEMFILKKIICICGDNSQLSSANRCPKRGQNKMFIYWLVLPPFKEESRLLMPFAVSHQDRGDSHRGRGRRVGS